MQFFQQISSNGGFSFGQGGGPFSFQFRSGAGQRGGPFWALEWRILWCCSISTITYQSVWRYLLYNFHLFFLSRDTVTSIIHSYPRPMYPLIALCFSSCGSLGQRAIPIISSTPELSTLILGYASVCVCYWYNFWGLDLCFLGGFPPYSAPIEFCTEDAIWFVML